MDFNIRDRKAMAPLARRWNPYPTRIERAVEWLDQARRTGNRAVFAALIGGGAVLSLTIGMVLGGAFDTIDVALPPPTHPGPGPIIDYAAPTTAPHRVHTSHATAPRTTTPTTTAPQPATASAESTVSTTTPTTTTSTTVPKAPTTTTTQPQPVSPPAPTPTTTRPPNPLLNLLKKH